MTETQNMHIPQLTIKNFRGIDLLAAHPTQRLGRANLVVGQNQIGKTSLLEAIRIYATNGSPSTLIDLLTRNDELVLRKNPIGNKEDSKLFPDWDALFYNRNISEDVCISIKTGTDMELKIMPILDTLGTGGTSETLQGLRFEFFDGHKKAEWDNYLHERSYAPQINEQRKPDHVDNKSPEEIPCEIIGMGSTALDNNALGHRWDQIALTDKEEQIKAALGLILKDEVKGVLFVGDNTETTMSGRRVGRRPFVKLATRKAPVSLRSCGGAAVRLFETLIALENASNGFLLIEEAESSFHYSFMRQYWQLVFEAAQKNNVQVFATTQSFGCVKGFGRAASECEETESMLLRLSRQYGYLNYVEYPIEDVIIATNQVIEVR